MKKIGKEKIENIKSFYTQREVSKTDELIKLDKKVKRPAKIFGYVFGSIGSLVLGTGMCLAMKVIGNAFIPGIIIGIFGIAMVSLTYTLYKNMMNKRKQRYADEVLTLSESILNNN